MGLESSEVLSVSWALWWSLWSPCPRGPAVRGGVTFLAGSPSQSGVPPILFSSGKLPRQSLSLLLAPCASVSPIPSLSLKTVECFLKTTPWRGLGNFEPLISDFLYDFRRAAPEHGSPGMGAGGKPRPNVCQRSTE